MSRQRPRRGLRRLAFAAALALAALHGGLAWIAREPGVLTGQDDAEYMLLARSLLQGQYVDEFRVDTPLHRTYPPVYPAALAAWGTVAGRGFDSLVLFNVIVSSLAITLLFLILRRIIGSPLALLVVALLAINPELIRYAGGIRSEPLFLLLALMTFAMLRRPDAVRARPPPETPSVRQARIPNHAGLLVAAIVTAMLAALTRSVGVTLIAALGLHWLVQRRWLLVGVPALFAVGVIGAWLAWTAAGAEQFIGSSYIAELQVLWTGTDWIRPLPDRAIRWTGAYLVHSLPTVLAVPTIAGTWIDNVLLLGVSGVAGAIGLFVLLRKWRPAAIWLIVYALFLIIWLYQVDRFVVPVLPLIVTAIVAGAHRAGKRFGRPATLGATALVALILGTGALLGTRSFVRERASCDRSADYPDPSCISEDQRSYFEALRWIEANTPEDAVFLSAKPGALYLYTGRRTIGFDRAVAVDEKSFIGEIRGQGAGWILLGNLHVREPQRMASRLAANCGRVRLVAAFPPNTLLFALGGGTTDGRACSAIQEYIAANGENSFGEIR